MKGSHVQIASAVLPHDLGNACAHLSCRLIGKGQRQDAPWFVLLFINQISNLVGQHARLTRSCASNNQLRAVTIFDGGPLSFVQFKIHHYN